MKAPGDAGIDPGWIRLLDGLPSGCCILDEDCRVRLWNRTLAHWTGAEPAQVLGRPLTERFPELAEPRFMDRIQAVLKDGVPALFSSPLNPRFFPSRRPDGRPRIQQTALNRLEGPVPLALITVVDITDQHERGEKYRTARAQALEEARVRGEGEAKHRAVVELSSDAILAGDVDGTIQDANGAAYLAFRFDPGGLQGRSILDLVAEEHAPTVRLVLDLESGTGDDRLEIQCRRSDGSLFLAEFSVKRFQAGGAPRFVAYVRDITERQRGEEVLRQVQKQESLGVLAGGIAHDFNNLLGAVLGNLELAQARVLPDAPLYPYLRHMEQELLRASELSRKMLAFSGKGRVNAAPLDLDVFLKELRPLLEATLQKRARLEFQPAGGLSPVQADEGQLQQAILALAANAGEALGEQGGHVRIRTFQERLDLPRLRALMPGQPLHPGPYVALEIQDDGCGISPENVARIFDPFYTTKFTGRGLSLSVVQGIVRGHHAGISVWSSPGAGSRFTLYFPASSAPAPAGTAKAPRPSGGRGRLVLLVDDEAVLRDTTAELLEDMGYQVITAVDGQEAVEAYRTHTGQIALVLMDVTMPRLDGRSAFLALKELDPEAKVYLMSGYSEQDVTQPLLDRGLLGFLPKPYKGTDLEAILRRHVPEPEF